MWKLIEAMIVFSTIVSGSFCIGHLLRLSCDAEQDILFMVFIEYLSKDFGLSCGKLRELDITYFTVPFKLAKCDGTFCMYLSLYNLYLNHLLIGSGNKTILGIFLNKSAKEAIKKHITEYFDDASIEELWDCTRFKAPFKKFYTDKEARISHPCTYNFKAFSE